jgi:hypothetical protein
MAGCIIGMKLLYHGLSIFNNMEARYRQDYPGEFVITETKFSGGKKQVTQAWIDNPIVNQHISGRAAAIGSDDDQEKFNYRVLSTHRGGLLGSLKLQTYGTAKIAQQMRLDFTVDTNINNLQPLVENQYSASNIVYTTSRNCIRQPGEFYLIPLQPAICTEVLPIYLAAFDGHTEIYTLGYNKEMPSGTSDWIRQVTGIVESYSNTIFTFVGNKHNMPADWLSLPNTRTMDHRDFVCHCDV